MRLNVFFSTKHTVRLQNCYQVCRIFNNEYGLYFRILYLGFFFIRRGYN